jgi:hypothetical protein
MTTYLAITNDGRNKLFSAYTQSDAYQQAYNWAGGDGLRSFEHA